MDVTIVHGGAGGVFQKRRVRRNAYSAKQYAAFFDALASTCNVTLAAQTAGIDVSNAYLRRRTDPVFAEIWSQALEIGYHRLEAALLAYAIAGVETVAFVPSADAPAVVEPHLPRAGLPRKIDGTPNVQLALAVLNRHRASIEGPGKPARAGPRATSEQTDALLRKQLDALARRLQAATP